MSPIVFIAVTIVATLAMEPISARIHRYLGHGPLWTLHRGHHETPVAGPELNDVIPAVSAAVTIGAFATGVYVPGFGLLAPLAAGATLYGFAYFVLHDIYIHRRLPLLPRHVSWLEPFKRAHLEHHRTGTDFWGISSRLVPASEAAAPGSSLQA